MQREPTVVLVDDDQSVRDALKWLIESVDLHVDSYASATEFLESFDFSTPGCLVLDVRMPGMSGLELQENLAAYKCLFIGQQALIPVWTKCEYDSLALFFQNCQIAVLGIQPSHASDWVGREVHQVATSDRQRGWFALPANSRQLQIRVGSYLLDALLARY